MSAINAPDLPEPTLVGLQAVFRFASIGRGNPALDAALYERVREHLPMRLVQRSATEPAPNVPHIVVSSTTAQLAVGLAQADVVMQLQDAAPSELTAIAGGLLESIRAGLIDGGVELAMMGLITTAQTSTRDIGGFSPEDHILRRHMNVADVSAEYVQDLSVVLNLKVADRYFVGLNLSNYETRQFMQSVLMGGAALPVMLNPWEGALTDTGIQLRVDVNNQLDARLHGAGQIAVTEEVLQDVLRLTQTTVGDLAQNFISDAILPMDALEGALKQ